VILMPPFMVAGGLFLLLLGGEVLLRGAVSMAGRLGLSPLLIGMTVVAAATSMPELVVSITAGLEGAPDLAVGNVIGSNIANILLILGAAAVLYPMVTKPRHVLRDGLAMLGGTLVFILLAFMGTMGRLDGLMMLSLLVLYLAYCYRKDRRLHNSGDGETTVEDLEKCCTTPVSFLLVAFGVGILVLGSELLIEGAVDLAREFGVSEAVIGLTLVAVGTSLPELATAIVASLRRHPEVALGNVLGSNLFNLLAIIPALTITTPVMVAPEILNFDIWVMAGVSVVCLMFMTTAWRIGRVEGAALLIIYGGYIAILFGRGHMPV
jgi:cation:H+ antiporter